MSFQDDVAYLLLFSEALVDLLPDAVAVLDERGVVRAANAAFSRSFGQPGTLLAGSALLGAAVPDRAGRSLDELLPELVEAPDEVVLGRLEERPPAGRPRLWDARCRGWDSEDPTYRRLILCLRPVTESSGPPPPPGREARDDLLFALMTRTEALLDHLPLGVCVLDSALRVRVANRHLQEALEIPFRPGGPGDRHLFSVFPVLRDPEFLERLERCRDAADSIRGVLSVDPAGGRLLEIEVEVSPIAGDEERAGELLLLFHEVRGMSPPVPSPISGSGVRVPAGPERILTAENLARWAPAANRRLLLVEADAWSRMLLSDTLRECGFDDVTLCDSGSDLFARGDAGSFGLVIVGIDSDPEDAAGLCRRLTAECPQLPVLALTQRPPAEAADAFADLTLFGVASGTDKRSIEPILAGLYRGDAGTDAGDGRRAPTDARTYDLIVIGAGEAEVPILRMLYRVQEMRVRMVFDPDPAAFGLSLAQNLGIPALSGELSLELETPPDAVVLARPGLEAHLESLALEGVTRVTPDEIELFLVDPESFLETDRAPDRAAPEPPRDREDDGGMPPTLGAQALEVPPVRLIAEAIETGAEADERAEAEAGAAAEAGGGGEPGPEAPVDTAPEVARNAPPRMAAPESVPPPMRADAARADAAPAPEPRALQDPSITGEVDSLLGALDMLLDFDRFADRLLGMALGLSGGATGSLMVVHDDRSELRIAAARGLSEDVVRKTRQRIGEGVAGRVAESGEPLLLTGAIRDASIEARWDRPDVQSSICAPIISGERVIAVVCINSGHGGVLGREQLDRVTALGRQVGTALDRSLLLRRMRGRSFELAVRAEIEGIVSSRDDSVSKLRRCADRLAEMLGVDTCGIYLMDAKRGELVLRASAGLKAQTMDAVAIAPGTGVVGWVAHNLRPAILSTTPDLTGEAAVYLAAVPIRHYTDLIGVLAMETTAGVPFDDERLSILSSVAAVIGRDVGGARAYEDSEHKVTMLSALSELGLALGAVPERDGLARLVAFTACTVLSSDVASVRLIAAGRSPSDRDLSGLELLSVHGASLQGDDPLAELERRIAGQAVSTGLPCRDVDLPAEEAARLLERANVASALGVPLATDTGDLFGALVVYRVIDGTTASQMFREEEVEIGMRLADYATASAQRFSGASGPSAGAPEGESW